MLEDLTTHDDLTDVDKIPAQLQPILALYRWSYGNEFGSAYKPFHLYLDLVGWSREELGEILFRPEKHHQLHFGAIEMDYIADALKCWADRPTDSENYISKLIESEYYDD